MHNKRKTISLSLAALALLIMILDSKTAFLGASQGVNICIYTVIPSLLPFFIMSIYVTSGLSGWKFAFLKPVIKHCGVPNGGEALLLIGLLGGYPVGAQCVTNAYESKSLPRQTAERMLGFCNNAGPAFIFGMMSSLFTNRAAPWLLWIIHMSSALLTGFILPGKSECNISITGKHQKSISQVLSESIKAIANVCCWVILFRIIILFCTKWFLWLLPLSVQVVITGFLELVNGCQTLRFVQSEPIRFIIASCIISLGGLCVYLQTLSVTSSLGTGMYVKGKMIQTYFSLVFSVLASLMLYRNMQIRIIPAVMILLLAAILMFFLIFPAFHKKRVAIPK